MGTSTDWLDIYANRGRDAVAAAIDAALARALDPLPPEETQADGAGAGGEPPPPDGTDTDHAHKNSAGSAGESPRATRGTGEKPVLPEDGPGQADVVLEDLFSPEDRVRSAYTIRRFSGQWWSWSNGDDGARWKCVDDDVMLLAAVRRRLCGFEVERYNSRKGGVTRQPCRPTHRAVDDILKAACDVVGVTSETMPCWLHADFDQLGQPERDENRWRTSGEADGPIEAMKVIAFRNGLLDVEAWIKGTVRLIPHTPRWFGASVLDTDLDAEMLAEDDEVDLEERIAERCPAWLAFLAELSRGSAAWIEALQRFVGYCLTPDTSLDKMLWVQGPPGSGKTTLQEGVEYAVGIENVAGTDLDALSDRFGVGPLVGKMLATIPELHVGNHTNVARALQRLKSISGGAPQHVDDKYMRVRSRVRMTCKFMLTPNEEPRLPDASAALLRRLVVLPTSVMPSRPDPHLSDKLQDERGGIRLWALLGLRRLWRDVAQGREAFEQPAEGASIIQGIEAASSPVRQFVREECVVQAGSSVYTESLFRLWAAWCGREGHKSGSQATFGRKLRAAVAGVDRVEGPKYGTRRRYIYLGLRPRYESDDAEGPWAVATLCEVEPDPYIDGLTPLSPS